MILNLINPSDGITFVGDDHRIAGVAVLLLGNGWYGLTYQDGNEFVPLMVFGAAERWLKEQGIENVALFIVENSSAIADFLDTCALYSAMLRRFEPE